MKKLLLIIYSLLPSLLLAQGKPFAVWEDQISSDYWFVSLDAASGTKTNISIIPGLDGFVSGSNAAFNGDAHLYHFIGLSGGSYRLYSINSISGAVVNDPVITENIFGLHYNCNDSLLYAVREINNDYDLVSIDPSSANPTSIVQLTGFTSYVGETFSFNPKSQLLTFVVFSSGFHIRSYHVKTGALIHNNLFPDNITALRYSCRDSSIFGLWENAGVYSIEKVNPATGTHATVNTLNGVTPGYVLESASVNSNGNYIYRGFDSNNNVSLISIDLSGGNLLNIVNTTENSVGFQEPICCYDFTTSISMQNRSEDILVYPNPFTNQFNITSEKLFIQIEVFSTTGEIMADFNNEIGIRSRVLRIPELQKGIYLLKITFNDGTNSWQKIIKE